MPAMTMAWVRVLTELGAVKQAARSPGAVPGHYRRTLR
jgi:hypothetical protein